MYHFDNEMNGIINFLNKESNNSIDEKITFTASGICSNSDLPQNVALHNDHSKYFESSNNLNSWICLDFKDKRVIPTDYTIKSADNTNYIRNWTFECSNDNINWTILDEQQNCQYLKGNRYIYTYKINKKLSTEFRYIRIRQTGPNWLCDQ